MSCGLFQDDREKICNIEGRRKRALHCASITYSKRVSNILFDLSASSVYAVLYKKFQFYLVYNAACPPIIYAVWLLSHLLFSGYVAPDLLKGWFLNSIAGTHL